MRRDSRLMNADIMQIIFDFAGIDERIQMRRAFGEIFRYPRLKPRELDVKQVDTRDLRTGCLLRGSPWSVSNIPFVAGPQFVYSMGNDYRYVFVGERYRIVKSMCYFGGHEKVETFVGEYGLFANKSLGSLCILPWCVRPACNKPRE